VLAHEAEEPPLANHAAKKRRTERPPFTSEIVIRRGGDAKISTETPQPPVVRVGYRDGL